MVADAVLGQPFEGVVQGVDTQGGELAVLLDGGGRVGNAVLGDDAGVVDLEDEAGVDDGAVLLAHGLGDGGEELLLGGVEAVPTLQLDGAGGDGRDEGFFGREALQGRLEGCRYPAARGLGRGR